MVFSGALTLTDLNDFITPSQACIKPVEQTNKPEVKERDAGAAATEIHVDESGAYYEVGPATAGSPTPTGVGRGKKLEQAQISLNDCLACSGCITSAESVLITLQSHTEVLSVLSDNTDERIPIISIAPQSLASLAAAYSSTPSPLSSSSAGPPINGTIVQLTPREALHRIREFCTSILGFAYVFDTNFARHLGLKEHVNEFLERQQKWQQINNVDATTSSSEEASLPLPMLASACPGWICYAEKAHSEMLPFIARTKSPQQVMGTLVKKWIGRKLGKNPNDIYHVSVMPCYDKKLEASRQDFFDEIFQTREVDCVVTTGELELMMKELGWDLRTCSLIPSDSDSPPSTSIPVRKSKIPNSLPTIDMPELITHTGTSSGSYLHAIIHHIISASPVALTLNVKAIRNAADYEEYTLRESSSSDNTTTGKVVFKGVKCYGFRNLQNIVRKVGRERGVRVGSGAAGRLGASGGAGAGRGVRRLRTARKGQVTAGATSQDINSMAEEEEKKFDYVEVMACPGGCVNGGGQLRPPPLVSPASGPDSSTTTSEYVDVEGYKRDWDGEGVAPSVSSKWGDREWTKKVEEVYWRDTRLDDERCENSIADQLVDEIITELCAGNDDERKRLFRTNYRAVESDVIGLAVKW